MKQRIYIDTSVVVGFFDEEFKEATVKLFERLNSKGIIFVVEIRSPKDLVKYEDD